MDRPFPDRRWVEDFTNQVLQCQRNITDLWINTLQRWNILLACRVWMFIDS